MERENLRDATLCISKGMCIHYNISSTKLFGESIGPMVQLPTVLLVLIKYS